MKRYLLFVGSDYYPWGGMEDLYKDFDSLGEAVVHGTTAEGKDFARQSDIENDWCHQKVDWWHVWDTVEGKVVADNKRENDYDPIVRII